jgi:tetratricopeptide (TPR) repeat protein
MPVANLLIGLVVTLGTASPASLSDDQLLDQAEAAYRKGVELHSSSLESRNSFARAAECYEELRRRGAHNAALYTNLGQSYLLAGDLPHALLAYQRGLRLAPNNAHLQDLLEEARNQVVYSVPGSFARPPVDNWPPWLPHLGLRLRLLLLLVLFGLGCACVTRWWMTRGSGLLGLAGFLFSWAVFLGVHLAFAAAERNWEHDHPLVILQADKVMLHKGDGSTYPCYDGQNHKWLDASGGLPPAATPLHRGVEAHLRFEKGDWLQIELAGGEVGWVRRAVVLIDTP